MSFVCRHKPLLGSNTWNRVYGWNDLDACQLTQFASNRPMIKPLFDYINATSNGFIRQCPYGPGFVRLVNATFKTDSVERFDNFQRFPNGFYRFSVRIYNRNDDNVVTFWVILETNYRRNVLNTNDKF